MSLPSIVLTKLQCHAIITSTYPHVVCNYTRGNTRDMETNRNAQEANRTIPEKPGILQLIRSNVVAVVIILALIMGYFLLRTSPSDIDSAEELQALIKTGHPVLVELYSNT